jgi:hypothetical protein
MKVPVDLVHMTPKRGMKFPLRQILEAMTQAESQAPVELEDLDPSTRAAVLAEMGKFNVHQNNMQGETAEGKVLEARNLVREAEMLENDAVAKRAKAYAIDPTLNPNHKKMVADKAAAKAAEKTTAKQ